jgi:hypothetical protein
MEELVVGPGHVVIETSPPAKHTYSTVQCQPISIYVPKILISAARLGDFLYPGYSYTNLPMQFHNSLAKNINYMLQFSTDQFIKLN